MKIVPIEVIKVGDSAEITKLMSMEMVTNAK